MLREEVRTIRFQSTLPVWGATGLGADERELVADFNPRSPCGERLGREVWSCITTGFQSTLPVWGATGPSRSCTTSCRRFQSTLPVWGATLADIVGSDGSLFQSTLPVWGATRQIRG